jgi:hypothetical protein
MSECRLEEQTETASCTQGDDFQTAFEASGNEAASLANVNESKVGVQPGR